MRIILFSNVGADIELGASTPLMEAATEGHVELVRFLIEKGKSSFYIRPPCGGECIKIQLRSGLLVVSMSGRHLPFLSMVITFWPRFHAFKCENEQL